MMTKLKRGASASYSGEVPRDPRHRGIPYPANNDDRCVNRGFRRMLARASDSVDGQTPTDSTPTATIENRNPDRAISIIGAPFQILDGRTRMSQLHSFAMLAYLPKLKLIGSYSS